MKIIKNNGVEVDFDELSYSEVEYIIEELMMIKSGDFILFEIKNEFDNNLLKLKNNFYSLSNDEVDTITKIAKRFI
jgi:hypothetical protein